MRYTSRHSSQTHMTVTRWSHCESRQPFFCLVAIHCRTLGNSCVTDMLSQEYRAKVKQVNRQYVKGEKHWNCLIAMQFACSVNSTRATSRAHLIAVWCVCCVYLQLFVLIFPQCIMAIHWTYIQMLSLLLFRILIAGYNRLCMFALTWCLFACCCRRLFVHIVGRTIHRWVLSPAVYAERSATVPWTLTTVP